MPEALRCRSYRDTEFRLPGVADARIASRVTENSSPRLWRIAWQKTRSLHGSPALMIAIRIAIIVSKCAESPFSSEATNLVLKRPAYGRCNGERRVVTVDKGEYKGERRVVTVDQGVLRR